MNTFTIVSCSGQTRAVRLPAAQLFIGPLFSAAITHARRFTEQEQDVRILSAQYGLLLQSQLLDPHEVTQNPPDAEARERLIATIQSQLPRAAVLPLRFVMLSPPEDVALFRAACAQTRFETVPIRAPLCGLNAQQQLLWLQSVHNLAPCTTLLPRVESLSKGEHEQLQGAARVASSWWSQILMKSAPPPDPALFAHALALEIGRVWTEIYAQSRGEWPEDLAFPIAFQGAPGNPIGAAFQALGIDAQQWWKREWNYRRLTATMSFSMQCVRVTRDDQHSVLWQK